ncbi:MAG: hypothetical protein ACRC4M_01200 [Mycoplasma sp.]
MNRNFLWLELEINWRLYITREIEKNWKDVINELCLETEDIVSELILKMIESEKIDYITCSIIKKSIFFEMKNILYGLNGEVKFTRSRISKGGIFKNIVIDEEKKWEQF